MPYSRTPRPFLPGQTSAGHRGKKLGHGVSRATLLLLVRQWYGLGTESPEASDKIALATY